MKRRYTIIIALIMASYGLGISQSTTAFKNLVGIELYQPIQTIRTRELENNSTVLPYSGIREKKISAFSTGIAYEREFKENLTIRTRVGISLGNTYNEVHEPEKYDYADFVHTLEYQERHLNLFLAIMKRIKLKDKFTFDIGLDLGLISQFKAIAKYKTVGFNYHRRTNNVDAQTISDYGKATSVGLGPILKPSYKISNRVSISIEAQVLFMNTKVNDVFTESVYSIFTYGPSDIEFYSKELEIKINSSQWSWSRISPLFRIGYKF